MLRSTAKRLVYLSFFACATRLSITCSKASLSPKALSSCFCQYSKTCSAVTRRAFRLLTCFVNSSSVKLSRAASVVAHSIEVVLRSSSGGGGGPFRGLSDLDLDESTDVFEAFSLFTRSSALLRPSDDGRGDLSPDMFIEGRMSFFCFEAGKISSRSTGTPSETRKSRRILERTQSGGCSGGGATSCVHKE